MSVGDTTPIDLTRPRTVSEVVVAALTLFGRYPLLFAGLAVAVVAPYELVVLAISGTAPFGQQNVTASTAFTLLLLDVALVGPLVSALHVHAVRQIGDGERPSLRTVAALGLRRLPVVAAAQIVAGIGILIGFLALIIPGVILTIRWAVVAQAAAIEETDWMGALRRSGELTRLNYLHVAGIILIATAVNLGLTRIGVAVAGTSAHGGQVALGIAVTTLTRSFSALVSAVLWFDLVARSRIPRPARRL